MLSILKSSFFLFLTVTLLYANNTDDAKRILESGGGEYNFNTATKDIGKKEHKTTTNYSEVVYNHIKEFNKNIYKTTNGLYIEQASFDIQKYQESINKKEDNTTSQEKMPPYMFISGYCVTKNEIEVERLSSYSYLNCDFGSYYGELTVAIVPDFYSQVLVAQPLYVTINDKKYPVENGAVLNAGKTSINIATLVNDRKIEKIVATGLYRSSQIATKKAQEYLAAKQASKIQTQAIYNQNSNGQLGSVTTVTNTAPPDKKDYIESGGIEILSSLIEIIGESYINSIKYTFKVAKNTTLYADLMVNTKPNMNGIGWGVENLIIKNETNTENPFKEPEPNNLVVNPLIDNKNNRE